MNYSPFLLYSGTLIGAAKELGIANIAKGAAPSNEISLTPNNLFCNRKTKTRCCAHL